jgi:hypothetical protein
MHKLFLIVVLLLAMASASSAKPSTSTITQNVLGLTYGTSVNFTPDPDKTSTFTFSDVPGGTLTRLIVDCYQGRDWVYEAISYNPNLYGGSPWYSLELDSTGDERTLYVFGHDHNAIVWPANTAATCTVVSGYYSNSNHFVTTASLDFSVA